MVSQGIYYLSLILIAVIFFFLGAWFYRFALWYPRGRKAITGTSSLIGKYGKVIRDNGTVLIVNVDGVNWSAKFTGSRKPSVGDSVKVIDVKGLNITVEGESIGN